MWICFPFTEIVYSEIRFLSEFHTLKYVEAKQSILYASPETKHAVGFSKVGNSSFEFLLLKVFFMAIYLIVKSPPIEETFGQ